MNRLAAFKAAALDLYANPPGGTSQYLVCQRPTTAGGSGRDAGPLVLGRPRRTGQQTMHIADWEFGGLRDNHEQEARMYSLASGTFTQPDVTPRRCSRPPTTSRPGSERSSTSSLTIGRSK